MNILFVYSSPIIAENGGVQRVTHVLSSHFENKGYVVHFLSLSGGENLDVRQSILPIQTSANNEANREFLRTFLANNQIRIIINQDGLNPDMTQLVLSCKSKGVKVLSVAHNSITGAIQHYRYSRRDLFKCNHLGWILPIFDCEPLKDALLWAFKRTHKSHFCYAIVKSDRYILLSERYMPELEFVTDGFDKKKVIAICNPCTLTANKIDCAQKEKVLLYVGRIDMAQKRNDLLLEIWKNVSKIVKDWHLVIVGDGPDLEKLKAKSKKMQIKNVEFVGQAEPSEYYRKASLFAMTSAFEGLPLTLVEAMTHGVVPIAFDSFASLQSIIDDGVNGKVIRPFNMNDFASNLIELMNNNQLRDILSSNCLIKAKYFSLDVIGQKWLDLFREISNER